MTQDLTTFTASSAVAKSTPDAGTSASTEAITWNDTVLTFADLPAEARMRAPATGVLAENVRAISGVRIDRTGVARQTRLAFRTYAAHIVVLTLSRVLTKRADGRYAPAGAWTVNAQKLETVGGTRASRRVDSIKPGRLVTGNDGGQGGGVEPSREAEHAIHAESFLPAQVRSTLAASVAQPTTHLGAIIQWADGKTATQEVTVLRLDGARAIVVKAVRPDHPTAAWSVTQWSYDLRTDSRALSA